MYKTTPEKHDHNTDVQNKPEKHDYNTGGQNNTRET
jgi:hypothetical protein